MKKLEAPVFDVRKLSQLADNGPMCSSAAKKSAVRGLDDVRGKIASMKKTRKSPRNHDSRLQAGE